MKALMKVRDLRVEMIGEIKDFLKKANRTIIVSNEELSYIKFDNAFKSGDENEMRLVPEVEITAIGLNERGDIRFVDSKGDEDGVGALSTDELSYVLDYLLDLKFLAPEEQ